MNLLYDKGLIPAVNVLLSQGIPISFLPEFQMINPSITFGDRFLEISSDISKLPAIKTKKIIIHADKECIKKVNKMRYNMNISFVNELIESYPKEYIDIFTSSFLNENIDSGSVCQLFQEMFILGSK